MGLSDTITNSSIWQQTLAARDQDQAVQERERLRSAFVLFRERATHLAAEIRNDLPDLTVHDVTHLDALWEIASLIAGPHVELTPTEGFVLGGAILLHDMGMSIAATPGGLGALMSESIWKDLLVAEYRESQERDPTESETSNPDPALRKRVLFNVLRLKHAESAERLALHGYVDKGGNRHFLLDDTELRQIFGSLIGRLAHSHWWPVGRLEGEFGRQIGAPHWCPNHWVIDPLKIACVLRLADAAHLDARRAPPFLRVISNLSASSEMHWRFQEKLNKPYVADDALTFTSGGAFALDDTDAWWLCLETLRMVDRELRSVDALLAESGRIRFVVRRVAGVDNPERLVAYVRTDGWLPINATVHVTDLPGVVSSLGGDALYGHNPRVALRELMQNASDAVRARRLLDRRPETYGEIRVGLGLNSGDNRYWLEVADNGIGMSQRVLVDYLLDFGKSLWSSNALAEEFPGLLAGGFYAAGKFGIGFFSVFMIADYVEVITRRADAGVRDTLVLQFGSGLAGRPTLRPATPSERLIDGGTRVRVRLQVNPRDKGGVLWGGQSSQSLHKVCRTIAPALDVSMVVQDYEKGTTESFGADWTTVDGAELLCRVRSMNRGSADDLDEGEEGDGEGDNMVSRLKDLRVRAGENLRFLKDASGIVVGRACITVGYGGWAHRGPDIGGAVVVGGLHACELSGISGILLGATMRASRDSAIPIVSDKELKRWAEDQADLVPALWSQPESQAACAQYIRLCGGDTRSLPIALFQERWVSAADIASVVRRLDEIVIIDQLTKRFEIRALGDGFEIADNVIVVAASGIPGLLQGRGSRPWPSGVDSGFGRGWAHDSIAKTLGGAVVEAVAASWNMDLENLSKKLERREEDVVVGAERGRVVKVRGYHLTRTSSCSE